MEAYQAQQWPQAYAALAALADAGNASAARVAAMMARQGPLLFGQRFDVSPERLARWERTMRGDTVALVETRVTGPVAAELVPVAVRIAGVR
jgi:hypothetical protein